MKEEVTKDNCRGPFFHSRSTQSFTLLLFTSHIGKLEIYFNHKMILILHLLYFTMCYPGQLIRATRVTLLCSRCWMCLFNMPCTPYQNTVKGIPSGIIPVTIGPISIRDTLHQELSVLPSPHLQLSYSVSCLYLLLAVCSLLLPFYYQPHGILFLFISFLVSSSYYCLLLKKWVPGLCFQHNHKISHPTGSFDNVSLTLNSLIWVESIFPPLKSG